MDSGDVVRLGITMFATDRSMRPGELAAEAESRGFSSMYLPEHTHIPAARLTPAPTGDPVLPEHYRRTLDPFVALAAAAAVTSRIVLGTGICLLAQREPIVTAKAVATLDLLSGGRVSLGIGFGWNAEEGADHRVPWPHRRDVVREHLLAMRALWTQEEAAFDGAYVRYAASWAWPKPSRPGGPEVLIGGGAGPVLFRHVAEYADGWMPIGGRGIRGAMPALHSACAAAGRDPATVRVVPYATVPDPAKLAYYAAQGIGEVVLSVPSGPRDQVLPVLDRYAALAEDR